MTTYEPGAPLAAMETAVATAGPRAVGPVSSMDISLSESFF